VKNFQLLLLLKLAGAMLLTVTQTAQAQVVQTASDRLAQTTQLQTSVQENPHVSDIESAATTVEDWVAQMAQTSIEQVTGVQLNATANGFELVLESSESLPPITTSVVGNALIADIPNAVLALPDGDEFQQVNPAEGIALVTVTNRGENGIRVAITGLNAPPTANVQTRIQNLVLAVTTGSETEATQDQDTIQVVVTGDETEDDYYTPEATTATRTDTPIRDIPASVQVIPQQVLEDQNVVEYRDALRNAGVTTDGNYGGTGAGSVILRGFTQDFNFRNGFRSSDFYGISETANIERIEVLRGPASVLFGQTEPGGIINIVTEQPLSEPYYSVELTAGQFSFYRPSIDLSGPLTNDGDLLYRLNLAYQNSGSFRDEVHTERFFIAPVLRWNISDNTSLTFDFEYLYNDPVFDRGLTALSDGSLVLPIDRFLGYPQLDEFDQEQFRAGYTFEHQFNDDWRLRNAFSFFRDQQGGARTDFAGLPDENGLLPRNYRDDDFLRENYGLQTEMIGEFATGSIDHQLLVGVDLNRRTSVYTSFEVALPPIDIFDPNYDIDVPELEPSFAQNIRTDSLGIYVQDQIELFDNLHLLVGGRFDAVDQQGNDFGSELNQSNDAFSPRIGIVYQPIEPLSLYASYSQSFFPITGFSTSGDVFEPERSTQYEIGLKADVTDDLFLTLAAYYLTKANVATDDPDDPNFQIQVGEERSQGIELNVVGEILSGWNIIAAYNYTDAEVTEDNTIPVGSRLDDVPEHTASLWTTYEIQSGDLEGLGFGLGLLYVSERSGFPFDPPGFELPGYFRADAALYYRRDNWRAQLNIENLFDTKYYETSQTAGIVYPGDPLNVRATISYEF
jgi:iron complex outermembrane receptor protein